MAGGSSIVLLLLLPLAKCILPPASTGCSTSGCSGLRNGMAGSALPRGRPALLWSLATNLTAECSGDGHIAICVSSAGSMAACNETGIVWQSSVHGTSLARPTPPFISSGGALEGVSGALGDVGGRLGLVIRSASYGALLFQDVVDSPTAQGPWVLPRNGPSADSLVLVARGDGLIMVWNVELALCWATRFLCLQDATTGCNAGPAGRLWPVAPPAMAAEGGAAYFATTCVEAPGVIILVELTVGGMADRLPMRVIANVSITSTDSIRNRSDVALLLTHSSGCSRLLVLDVGTVVSAVCAEVSGREIWRVSHATASAAAEPLAVAVDASDVSKMLSLASLPSPASLASLCSLPSLPSLPNRSLPSLPSFPPRPPSPHRKRLPASMSPCPPPARRDLGHRGLTLVLPSPSCIRSTSCNECHNDARVVLVATGPPRWHLVPSRHPLHCAEVSGRWSIAADHLSVSSRPGHSEAAPPADNLQPADCRHASCSPARACPLSPRQREPLCPHRLRGVQHAT